MNSAISRFSLEWQDGDRQRLFPLQEGRSQLGSASENELVFEQASISRHHAAIEVHNGRVAITDLQSKNGTTVNGAPVVSTVPALAVGDEIGIGRTVLRLVETSASGNSLAFALPRPLLESPRSGLETEVEKTQSFDQLAIFDRLLTTLEQSDPAPLASALAALAQGLHARQAVLLERSQPNNFAVRAAWGWEQHESLEGIVDSVSKISLGQQRFVSGRGTIRDRTSFRYGILQTADTLLAVVVSGIGPEPANIERLLRLALSCFSMADSVRVNTHSDRRSPRMGALASNLESMRNPRLEFPPDHVVGNSKPMTCLYREVEKVAAGNFPVLLLGETGVGKEHFVRIIHASSQRRDHQLVAVNCAAIPAELLEAELFGIRSGVATGVTARQGHFEKAGDGTIFLDEVGELSLPLQAKLLRVLEAREVHPVGGTPIEFRARVVSATNVDLLEKVESGNFRADLYYRLAGYTLIIPPLRERKDDIAGLVEFFVARYAAESNHRVSGVTVRALGSLIESSWPGNVRELAQQVRGLVYGCHDGEAIDLVARPQANQLGHGAAVTEQNPEGLDLAARTAALEREMIVAALRRTGTNRSEAARLLGISRQGLGLKIQRLGIAIEEL